jgi:hypothetical protein
MVFQVFLYIRTRKVFQSIEKSHIQKRKEDSQILSFHVQLERWLPLVNNCKFSDFVNRIYLIEFEIKDTADTYISA